MIFKLPLDDNFIYIFFFPHLKHTTLSKFKIWCCYTDDFFLITQDVRLLGTAVGCRVVLRWHPPCLLSSVYRLVARRQLHWPQTSPNNPREGLKKTFIFSTERLPLNQLTYRERFLLFWNLVTINTNFIFWHFGSENVTVF